MAKIRVSLGCHPLDGVTRRGRPQLPLASSSSDATEPTSQRPRKSTQKLTPRQQAVV